MDDVRFVDTTFRDGSQSLWAMGMRTGMMASVAEDMERAGFEAVEVPILGIFVKKFVRDLKEDPWEMARMVAKTMPRSIKTCMAGAYFHPFEAPPPRAIVELFYARLAEIGALNRGQMTCNTTDQIKGPFTWIIPAFKNMGLRVSISLAYTLSPRHTDEYYAQKTREILPFAPDVIYLKDQGGLLTIDRLRTLLPLIVKNANGLPVELHSHCTTGLAPLVYLEALKLGVRILHTALPPLANGASQPSLFNVANNARLMGYTTTVDEALLRIVSERLTAIAKQDSLPIGAPLEYDYAQSGPGVSDEEFLLRYIMKGEQEIEAMRAVGPPRQYFNTTMPLLTLLNELDKQTKVRYVNIQRGRDALLVHNTR